MSFSIFALPNSLHGQDCDYFSPLNKMQYALSIVDSQHFLYTLYHGNLLIFFLILTLTDKLQNYSATAHSEDSYVLLIKLPFLSPPFLTYMIFWAQYILSFTSFLKVDPFLGSKKTTSDLFP
jgi:hypothetical protein